MASSLEAIFDTQYLTPNLAIPFRRFSSGLGGGSRSRCFGLDVRLTRLTDLIVKEGEG